MPRNCFVIMPFSTTASCSEEEWTWIFEHLFKPIVEGAGLDYECRRSVATRGNLVAAILQDLNDAYIVIADLTDRNANVFYELGVRHSLKNRSILLAQRDDDIPFDLQAYAYHVYEWKTDEGQAALATKLRQLLLDVDAKPERPDNPVSDFLHATTRHVNHSLPAPIFPDEAPVAQPLAGPGAEGLDAREFARKLSHMSPQAARIVSRLTRQALTPKMQEIVDNLNRSTAPPPVQTDKILDAALKYISQVEPLTQKVEQFALTSVDENWPVGVEMALQVAGDWISISERTSSGQVIRYAQGAPAVLAWRLLVLMGARALEIEAFDILGIILREPIESEDYTGKFANRSFLERRDLFYPEGFLGYANHPIKYLQQLWKSQPHLEMFFGTEQDYDFTVAKFLMVVTLASSSFSEGHALFPGYRLMPQSKRAMSSLCSRLAKKQSYLEGVAKALGESATDFRQKWSKRVTLVNNVEIRTPFFGGVMFPNPMDARVSEWY
jgi:hypothetical protein